MADTEDAVEASPANTGSERRQVARLAKHIGAFARAHGGSTEGQIAYLGQRGARIVLVAGDGAWGDVVATSRPIAEQAAERAGITVHDALEGELAGRMRTGRYEWSRMAGIQLGGGEPGR